MNKLKQRWGITSNFQLIIIFIVFAITGSSSAWLSKPFCEWLGVTKEDFGMVYPNPINYYFPYLSGFTGCDRNLVWAISVFLEIRKENAQKHGIRISV